MNIKNTHIIMELKKILSDNEIILGSYIGKTSSSLISFLLLDSLSEASVKHYVISLTNKKLYVVHLNILGSIKSINSFFINELIDFSLKKSFLNYNITYKFKNGESLNLKSQNISEDLIKYHKKYLKNNLK
ncbi:hypothetical protein OSC52_02595 [Clostridium pasteurianum]|uniref:hypothetical protein n=1 Tax=Clostridium pasteurianum TaxID=1501 RepID=UPI002260FF1A|nr:hypothetical protein [Clostridium pasteurianum]UZW14754.1 hypothetical protein OSC52_02595 [Clostridium pasteurianum]